MDIRIRRKLAMAVRVRDFSRAHPDSNTRYIETVTRLEERLARAQDLDTQQRGGHLTAHAATELRKELRRALRNEFLSHLARIAAAASKEHPTLGLRLPFPLLNSNHQAFLTAARDMADVAQAHHDVFVSFGMPETFLDDFGKALDAYQAAVNQGDLGNSAHVGARADLKAVTAEVMELVKQLDAMHRYRYRKDPEQLAIWEFARDVAWPNGKKAEKPAA